ncbi:MAG: hypothetical protein R2712_18035 [Vicinamibacterales bacterium]
MSRIHKILSKAERDGTTARLAWQAAAEQEAGVPSIAEWRSVPTSAPPEMAGPPARVLDESSLVGGRPVFGVRMHKLLVAANEPFSEAAEQYRTLRARVTQAEGEAPRRVLSFTSPCRGDGTSTTVTNLALSMAQEFERRTVLIDADLRHARVTRCSASRASPGWLTCSWAACQWTRRW